MSISAIYQELLRNAKRTGEDRRHDFRGGARLAVRVRDNVITLTIARKIKRVGDTELLTFYRDCDVPRHATRWPANNEQATRTDDAGVTWYVLAFQWSEDKP
jgi:hypothetical protein